MAKKEKQKSSELVYIPWGQITQMRAVDDARGGGVGEYVIKSRYGNLIGYDLTGLIAPPAEPGKLEWNPRLIAVENADGKTWRHRWQGWGADSFLYEAVMLRLIHRQEYLLMRRDPRGWIVLGSEYAGQIHLRTGGYTRTPEERWCEGEPLSYEFSCDQQKYHECLYHGEMEIKPVENFFTNC